MNNLKLRVLPYAGVLTVIASLAGYFGGARSTRPQLVAVRGRPVASPR